ncbi:guanine nucleotide exchange factor DBS-like isoform X3 [Mizuhopecten yessoensis]|uniref:guanine nucleotide exchange factor DBS-like isoform X3 n=1 Tax=Mizuhopecten yessoensis TaxID=6573 RepID=UPI000B4585DA|nr:guanine nucleotide exchange factor DBS-like isoform X3 [Mizuhopecten yessoensis]
MAAVNVRMKKVFNAVSGVRPTALQGSQVAKIERDIDNFLENFRRKSSVLDDYNQAAGGQVAPCMYSSSQYSGSQYSTDDTTDDSPDRAYYLGLGNAPPRAGHHRQHSNTTTTSESEWGPDAEDDIEMKERLAEINKQKLEAAYALKHAQLEEPGNAPPPPECEETMVEAVCPYSVLDVAQLLQANFAFVSGGKAKNGAPIMTFPENPQQPDITDSDYKKIVHYLSCIPPLHETELGFVIVLDRRQAGWSSVKSLLLKMSDFFPKHLQVVFLLQPHGFFQRAFADMRSKFVKEELEFKVVMCNDPNQMFEYIDPSQLTKEVGGQLEYDANEWTQHRAAVEKFSTNTEKIATAIAVLVKKFQEMEVPNDVKGTEALIHDHIMGRKEIINDLMSSDDHGKTILSCIKGDNPRTPMIHQTHVLNLERLLMQLEETKSNFERFWEVHEKRLKQSLQLRQFEEEFKLFQYSYDHRMEELEKAMSDIGATVQHVETLIQNFHTFEEQAKRDLEQAEKMRTNGEQFIMDDHYAVDSIRPKCIELQRMCDQYRELLRRRRDLLDTSHDLQDRIDKANKWCTKGVDMLSKQQVDACQSPAGAELALKDIESFVATARELRLNNPKEFRQLFESMITPETRANVQKVLKRIEDVQAMCEKRHQSLQQVAKPSVRPNTSHRVPPTHGHPPHHPPHQDSDPKRKTNTENQQRQQGIYERSARLRTDATGSSRPYITPPCTNLGSLPDSLNVGEKTRASVTSMSTTTSSGSSGSARSTSMMDTDTLMAKRRHVLNELIETEKTYVSQLYDIIKGYLQELDSRPMQHLIPDELVGKKEILFGNLEQIYSFHKNIFLQELQNCRDQPAKVGKCFANRNEEFHLYSVYCQNKLRSEALRNQVGDQNPFFLECQRKLGHKLPLGAYLLKPVQRITKYQLLLKEMLRFSEQDPACEAHIQEALDSMLDVVRFVNDSMHQVSIVSFPGNLSDQGRLLMQGAFNVFTEHQRGRIKDIRFKPMQRHMFLYEKSILLCKRKEEIGLSSEKGVYSFKNLLKLSQVGLTENIKGDKKKFELWLRGREEVYIIQAPTLPCKDMWVKEIKRVLMNQFDQLKSKFDVHHLNLAGKSEEDLQNLSEDLPCNNSRYVDNWRSNRQASCNNNAPTVPQGLEMMSPESPPAPPHDDDGWSSGEFTNSDEDESRNHDRRGSEPAYLQQYKSIGDFRASDANEVSLRESDVVEIIRTGSTGWWYARHLSTNQEGWVPSTYLIPFKRRSSQSHFSMSSIGRF